jgi:hypothetical protein
MEIIIATILLIAIAAYFLFFKKPSTPVIAVVENSD